MYEDHIQHVDDKNCPAHALKPTTDLEQRVVCSDSVGLLWVKTMPPVIVHACRANIDSTPCSAVPNNGILLY